MKSILSVTCVVGCLLIMPNYISAQSAAGASSHLSRHELHRLQREANTPAQFKELADYFAARAREFRAKADDMKAEWERRSQNVSCLNAKAFRPVDSARNLYDYYHDEAEHASELAAQYEKRAATGGAAERL